MGATSQRAISFWLIFRIVFFSCIILSSWFVAFTGRKVVLPLVHPSTVVGIGLLPTLFINWSDWLAPAFALNAGLAVLAGERILERIFHTTERL